MSKKKGKAAKGTKIPKHVAGIKLPKDVRRKGEALLAQATSPAGQAAIAKGLTLAAGLATMAAQGAAERSRQAATPRPGESAEGAPPPSPGAKPPVDPAKMVEAVSTVADAVLGRLFGAKKA